MKRILNIDIMVKEIKEAILLEKNYINNITRNTLISLIRGFIPKCFESKIGKNIKSFNQKKSILRNIINGLQEGFHKYIWKPRCNRWKL